MTSLASMTRRRFLQFSVFLGSMVLTRDLFGAVDVDRMSDPLPTKLVDVFHDKKSARAVGLEYLRMAPTERNAGELIKLICSSQYQEWARADRRKMKDLLLRRQREDFELGRIFCVQGWILSATEARLCALAALV
jgi:hypothetical protein